MRNVHPYFYNAKIHGISAHQVINDDAWFKDIFVEADPFRFPQNHLSLFQDFGNQVNLANIAPGQALRLEALESWDVSLYRRLRESRETEARHPWLDRILRYYILTVLTLAVIGSAATAT